MLGGGVFFFHEENLYVAEQNFTAAEAGGKKKQIKPILPILPTFALNALRFTARRE